jgi:hypothetical protein
VPLHAANEALAFLLEIIALTALGWWGLRTGGPAAHVVLGVGAPLLAAVIWGLFAAPRARMRLPLAGVLAVKVLVYAAATAALSGVGHPALAMAFAVMAAASTALVTADRRAAIRTRS